MVPAIFRQICDQNDGLSSKNIKNLYLVAIFRQLCAQNDSLSLKNIKNLYLVETGILEKKRTNKLI